MQQLSGLDTSFLNMETSTTYGHVSGLAIFDPSTTPGQMQGFEKYAAGPQSVSIRSARKSTKARTFGAKCRLCAKTAWMGVLGGTKGKSSSRGTRCPCLSSSRIIQVGIM